MPNSPDTTSDNSLKLLRELVSSLTVQDLIDASNRGIEEAEALNLAADAETFYKNHFKDVLKKLIFTQILFLAKESQSEQQALFARGCLNAFYLMDDWFQEQAGFLRGAQDEKRQNKESPIDETLSPLG